MYAEEKKSWNSVPQNVLIFKVAITKLQRTVKVNTRYTLDQQES